MMGLNMINQAVLSQVAITAVGTFFGTALFFLVRRIIRRLPEIKLPRISPEYYKITIRAVQVVLALLIAISVILILGWIIGKLNVPSPGLRVVCRDTAPTCTVEQRNQISNLCIARADVLAMEMFSEGLSSGGMNTQIAAMSAARRAKGKQFTLCVIENGFAVESCDKSDPDCL